MTAFRRLLYAVTGIYVLANVIWMFVVPDSLVKDRISKEIQKNAGTDINVTINGLSKDLFFTLSADSIDIDVDKTPALSLSDISIRFHPTYLLKKQAALSVKGKVGGGDIKGFFQLPDKGTLTIDNAELAAIPYLSSMGVDASGLLSASLKLHNNIIDIFFEVPQPVISFKATDVNLDTNEAAMGLILLYITPIHQIQGAVQIKGNTAKVTSINLEADKGFVRLKGKIVNRIADLSLEVMPSDEELSTGESMLITGSLAKYMVSPGYFVIPVKGPLM